MVQYIGVILFLLCIVHFVYQVIVLPSIRQSARDELFVLRDQLRAELILVSKDSDKRTVRAFKEIDDGINRSINRLHMLSLSNFIIATREIEQDKARFTEERAKFHQLLDIAHNPMPKQAFNESAKILKNVLVANSFMFVVYLFPLIFTAKFVGSLYKKFKQTCEYMLDSCMVFR
jgi:DNA-directed RNA polymerase subunit K/omega